MMDKAKISQSASKGNILIKKIVLKFTLLIV